MRMLGSNPHARVQGGELQTGKVNYFLGSDPQKWRHNVPLFGSVRYEEMYPGVDLVYYGNQRQLEYDFVVKPGADPNRIRLAFPGASHVSVDSRGELVLGVGGAEVRQHRPVVYQTAAAGRTEVQGSYRILSPATPGKPAQVAFEIAAYDATRPLVIDPVLSYSTYLGGEDDDQSYGLAVDAVGYVYITGRTKSTLFPVSPSARQTLKSGGTDVFVTKLDPFSSGAASVVYSTYIGGTADDGSAFSHQGVAVDVSGNAYITGSTLSADFPTTVGAYSRTYTSPFDDAFVTKLNPTGSALVYSTYLGGAGWDYGHSIAVDSTGKAYVAGGTGSDDFPLTSGAVQIARAGGLTDAFVAVFNAQGSGLVYSTVLGGSGNDDAYGIVLDSAGRAVIAGTTTSTAFPTAGTAFQTTRKGNSDAFIARVNINASGAAGLSYSTYLGGSSDENGFGLALDSADAVYITGQTTSSDYPTQAAIQNAKNGTWDAFVTKLTPAGSALTYSTYIGGTVGTIGSGIAVDASGSAYVTGQTSSDNFPSVNPLSGITGGSGDAFLVKINPTGTAYTFATRFGGSLGDNPALDPHAGIAVDSAGNVYFTGTTSSANLPVTSSAFQSALGGANKTDAFVALVSEGAAQPPLATPVNLTATITSSTEVHLAWTNVSRNQDGIEIERTGAGNTVTLTASGLATSRDDTGLTPSTTYTYRIRSRLGAQTSAYSAPVTAVTPAPPPAAPTNLQASVVAYNEIDLSWNDQSTNENGFEVYRSVSGGPATLLVTVGASTDPVPFLVTYVDTAVQASTTYTYLVRAVNADGNSAFEGPVQATTPPAPPATPFLATVTPTSSTQVTLEWRQSGADFTAFTIEQTSIQGGAEVVNLFSASGTSRTYLDQDLTPNTVYSYRIRAEGPGGESAYTQSKSTATKPEKPTVLSAGLAAAQSVVLNWEDPTGASGYSIERKYGSGPFSEIYRSQSAGLTTYTDNSVIANGSFTYRVRGFNSSGYSVYSPTAQVFTGQPLISLKLAKSSVSGGSKVGATVHLAGPAPSQGAVVALQSSNTSAATVPGTVTVQPGATSASFTVKTKSRKSNTKVTLTATLSGISKTASLTVKK